MYSFKKYTAVELLNEKGDNFNVLYAVITPAMKVIAYINYRLFWE